MPGVVVTLLADGIPLGELRTGVSMGELGAVGAELFPQPVHMTMKKARDQPHAVLRTVDIVGDLSTRF